MFGTSVVTVVDKDTQRKEKHRAIVKLSYEKNDGAAKKRAQRFERERRKELEKLEAEILPMRGVAHRPESFPWCFEKSSGRVRQGQRCQLR